MRLVGAGCGWGAEGRERWNLFERELCKRLLSYIGTLDYA